MKRPAATHPTNTAVSLPAHNFRLLCLGNWPADRVHAAFRPRQYVLPPPHAARSHAYWRQLTARGDLHLFNGELFRLEQFAASPRALRLRLSRTCYRDQIYSNAHVDELLRSHGETALVRGLGVSALVITVDGFLPMIRRSAHLGEEPGKWDVVGGHGHPDQHLRDGRPDLFQAIAEEVQTELNLQLPEGNAMSCCGLVENRLTRKPDLVFRVAVAQTMREVEQVAAFAAEAMEMTAITAVPATVPALTDFIARHADLTPSAHACLHLLIRLLAR